MSSRKEEERNEKIIRGLMKLPPNRRCINCSSLGPQYVCTNFWTFVCTTCSGIHREFTHRVKSVSMAKFTSQEVEALQKGGNQRARDIYLKDWDTQRLRLPDNSNADKIREFIKNVYLDKKFAGAKSSERPPRDSQKLCSNEDEMTRASSYHSYSQSPPYDFQYEERRYGHAPVLSRKPGSDRGLYDGKVSSFLSPSRLSDRSLSHLSDQTYEDRLAYERSNSRISDYSLSSGGDLFRSGVQSPNYQKDIGSPSSETSRDFSNEDNVNYTGNTYLDSHVRRDGGRVLRPQRTASCGSSGSFDSSSVSLVDVPLEPEHTLDAQYDNTSSSPSLPLSSIPGNSDGLDLFSAPFAPQNINSRFPESSSTHSMDLFQSPASTTTTSKSHQLPQTIPPSPLELFSVMPQQQPAATSGKKSANLLVPQNDGWATFDIRQHSAPLVTENSAPTTICSSNNNSAIDPLLSLSEWPSFQDLSARGPFSSKDTLLHEASQNINAVPNATSTELWNTFENSTEKLPLHSGYQSGEKVELHQPSTSEQYLCLGVPKEMNKDGSQSVAKDSVPPVANVSSHIILPPHDLFRQPAMAGIPSYPVDHKSINPFDLPYDPKVEYGDMSQFLDMSSLEVAPNGQMPSSLAIGANQPWFSQDPIPTCVPPGSEGGLGFITAQASGVQSPTVPSQGPVASIGGNPFA